MRKLLLIIGILFFTSCHEAEEMKKTLSGEHALIKFMPTISQKGSLSGSFFWFFGGINGESETVTYASFSWKLPDGSYAISNLPITKIRVHPDSSVINPYITFTIGSCDNFLHDMTIQDFLDYYILYATVYCKEEDFKPEIKINIYPEKQNQ